MRKKAPSFLSKFVFSGPIGFILSFFAEKYITFLVKNGVMAIDFGVYAAEVGMEHKEYKAFAEKAYKKAKAKVYTEDEKQKIREDYLAALRKFGTIGDGLRKH